MEKFRERKMAMMRTHKQNVESRLKREPVFLQPVHSKVLRAEGRKTCLEPDWYTENIYSNLSIDNSDDDKRRVFAAATAATFLNTSSNDDESDDLFILASKSPKRHGGYPKSSSCCFGATTEKPIVRRNISKSHSFSTPRGTKYDFVEMAEYNNGRTPLYRMCDREGCMSETCFTRELKPPPPSSNQYVMNEWDVRNKNYQHNDLFNDADVFSYDDDEYPAQRRDSLEQLFKAERTKMVLRNKFEKLNKYTDDFLDDYNRSFDDILRVTEYSSPNYYHPTATAAGGVGTNKNIILDIKPSKYDDSASESTDTDVELDDFYFDFEKYWTELKKKQMDADINRNTYKKSKEVNKLNNLDALNGNDCYDIDVGDECDVCDEELLEDEDAIVAAPEFAPSPYRRRRGRHRHSNAFSLLNNIFSIYKPNKYSPLNCHQPGTTQTTTNTIATDKNNRLKSIKSNKLSLLSSTARPLGVYPSICKSSTSRPLMIGSEPAFMHASSLDLPQFQIIPQKTGLKISPLYQSYPESSYNTTSATRHHHHHHHRRNHHFDRLRTSNGKPKYKLKSTTRPLTFW